MSVRKMVMAVLFGVGVVCLLSPRATADPPVGGGGEPVDPPGSPKCDDKCRSRQYFYAPKVMEGVYWKYETATCELCKFHWCVEDSNDKNTTATCTTKAGQEKGNKRWEIKSKSKCDFTNESFIEAEAADPEDAKNFTEQPIKYCPDP